MKNIIALSAAFLTAIRLQGAFADCNGGPDCDSGEYCDWTYDCLPCDEGYYCVKNLSSACASGQWSAQGSSSCSSSHSLCAAGKYSNGSGQMQTLGAADNKYSPAGNCGTIARTNTAGCSAWNTGANECTSCNANRYLSGANCPACPGHSSSSAGSASCACNTGYSADGTWNGAASTTTSCSTKKGVISFDANGASGAPSASSRECSYNALCAYPSRGAMTKTGHTFEGWGTDADCASGATSGRYTSSAPPATMYACWDPVGYKISYDANGGSGAPVYQVCYYGKTCPLTSAGPSGNPAGYGKFIGWADSVANAALGTAITKVSSIAADTTVYAIWEGDCSQSNTLPNAASYNTPTAPQYYGAAVCPAAPRTAATCDAGYHLSNGNCDGKCPPGSFCPQGNAGAELCVTGSVSAEGQSSCAACPGGKTTSGDGQASCVGCGNGPDVASWKGPSSWHADNSGVTNLCVVESCDPSFGIENNECVTCRIGKCVDAAGSCASCSAGYYCPTLGMSCSAEVDCPSETTSLAGAGSASDCYIPGGTVFCDKNNGCMSFEDLVGGINATPNVCYFNEVP